MAARLRAVDSSVVIAAALAWHEQHGVAAAALDASTRAVGHALLESYSVLTRLPDRQRVPASLAAEFLAAAFAQPPLILDAVALREVPGRLAAAAVTGGSTYDALIALTAAAHDAVLLTLDRRASETYRRCDVQVELLA